MWKLKYYLQVKTTDVLLYLMKQINKGKDRTLSHLLHNIADEYDPRPTKQWTISS